MMDKFGLLKPFYFRSFRSGRFAVFAIYAAVSLFVVACGYLPGTKGTHSSDDCVEVEARIETEPVSMPGDVLDDPAVWVHPYDRSKSQILVTNKKGGLHIYNLEGTEIQFIPAGRLNNVDVRYNFPFAAGPRDIAVASNRSFNALSIFAVDPLTGVWKEVTARLISSKLEEVYGLCLYRSMKSGNFYAIVNSKQGEVEQWELFCSNDSLVDARLVRQFRLNGQVEGCVADDETGYLYIAEERYGIWKFYADPVAPDRRLVADTNIVLKPQIEGIALYKSAKGKGYLIVAQQHKNSFAVFERQGINKFVGCFRVTDGTFTDGVIHTDGIELVELPLGKNFPAGMFVAHDGQNTGDSLRTGQNVKLINWAAIADRFNPPLIIDSTFNYRALAYPIATSAGK
ncbi:MAG: phytase [Bacteroidetes bacterium]|nr:phytase [Bacteroidota bacterium]